MAPSLLGGFTKSLAMTVLSEVGDKTFFAAAILAMRHPRKLVLAGCLTALIVMTALSASLGWVAPNLISRKWTHHVTTLLFFVFGIWSLWEGFKEDGYCSSVALQLTFCAMCFGLFVIDLAKRCNCHFRDSEELAEVEAELDAVFKSNKGESKTKTKANDDTKKQQRPFLMQFFSPIFIKAFSITFFGEWGDKSQVELSSGVLFLLFGIMSLLSGPGEL
ncbi:GDT1-like protein 4 [Zea mays]|uniref:GDT1 family protein n=2 Tax=Zea mays TaxID=4577 RepID=A0A1D6Q1H0_MAIZE|nr:GDT1-like protein 4 [Zea mays]